MQHCQPQLLVIGPAAAVGFVHAGNSHDLLPPVPHTTGAYPAQPTAPAGVEDIHAELAQYNSDIVAAMTLDAASAAARQLRPRAADLGLAPADPMDELDSLGRRVDFLNRLAEEVRGGPPPHGALRGGREGMRCRCCCVSISHWAGSAWAVGPAADAGQARAASDWMSPDCQAPGVYRTQQQQKLQLHPTPPHPAPLQVQARERLRVCITATTSADLWGVRREVLPWLQYHTELGATCFYVSTRGLVQWLAGCRERAALHASGGGGVVCKRVARRERLAATRH